MNNGQAYRPGRNAKRGSDSTSGSVGRLIGVGRRHSSPLSFVYLMRILTNGCQERLGRRRSRNFPVEDILERNELTIQQRGFILVLADDCAVQINTGKKSASAG